jgi:hypothetical protein
LAFEVVETLFVSDGDSFKSFDGVEDDLKIAGYQGEALFVLAESLFVLAESLLVIALHADNQLNRLGKSFVPRRQFLESFIDRHIVFAGPA